MPETAHVPPQADALAREITRITAHSPGDRSVLRHSLGKAPKDVAIGVHKIVVPLVPEHAPDAAERAYYMVAALIASQDRQARDQEATATRRRNLGYSLAQAAHKGSDDKSENLANRLELLARQDTDGLYRHLPRLILQLRGDQVRIDWGVLIRDLTRWAADPRQVAKEWAQSFYRTSEQLIAAGKRKRDQDTEQNENEETAS
jgi:CRISPR system Cascade subunit CasB